MIRVATALMMGTQLIRHQALSQPIEKPEDSDETCSGLSCDPICAPPEILQTITDDNLCTVGLFERSIQHQYSPAFSSIDCLAHIFISKDADVDLSDIRETESRLSALGKSVVYGVQSPAKSFTPKRNGEMLGYLSKSVVYAILPAAKFVDDPSSELAVLNARLRLLEKGFPNLILTHVNPELPKHLSQSVVVDPAALHVQDYIESMILGPVLRKYDRSLNKEAFSTVDEALFYEADYSDFYNASLGGITPKQLKDVVEEQFNEFTSALIDISLFPPIGFTTTDVKTVQTQTKQDSLDFLELVQDKESAFKLSSFIYGEAFTFVSSYVDNFFRISQLPNKDDVASIHQEVYSGMQRVLESTTLRGGAIGSDVFLFSGYKDTNCGPAIEFTLNHKWVLEREARYMQNAFQANLA